MADVNRDGLIDIGLHILEDQLAALVDAVATAGGNPAAVDPGTWNDLSWTYLRFAGATADLLDRCPPEPVMSSPSRLAPSSQQGAPATHPARPPDAFVRPDVPTGAPLTPKFTG